MGPTGFAQIASRYWQTYLPSQLSGIPVEDRDQFFARLGQQVADLVDDLTEENLGALDTTTPQQALMARQKAERQALEELVYTQKEPGTEDREM